MGKEFNAVVSIEDSGKRLDVFIVDFLNENEPGTSRTAVQKIISEGKVVLKDKTALKSNYKVKAGDEILIQLEDKKDEILKPEAISLDVVYEDDDIAVINKPVGLVVHPAPGNDEHTLANALLYRFKKLSDINPGRPGIVHRLDKETSGLLVIAKNNAAHLALASQFAKHTIKRKYIALVRGNVEFDENVIELPIQRHPFKRKNMSVGFSETAKFAKTHYRTLKRNNNFSLLELSPFTGRTHQLRVHLSFIGHPILGDEKYGEKDEFRRLALHAQVLGFTHPKTGKFIEFSCPIPKEFLEFIKQQ